MPSVQRCLVLHADDYGMNSAVNEGILRSFREGLLTSTSLLANAPGAAAALTAWPELVADVRAGSIESAVRRSSLGDALPMFDLGIHINLTQGRPLTKGYPGELLDESGQFPGIGPVFRHLRSPATRFRDQIRAELCAQIEVMRDHGIRPTHLNGHQYIEIMPGVSQLILDISQVYDIPVVRIASERNLARTVLRQGRIAPFALALIKRFYAGQFRRRLSRTRLAAPSRFFGTAHAGIIDRDTLRRFLRGSSADGCTEIGLHPAVGDMQSSSTIADGWSDPLAELRPRELNWLCDPSTCDLIASHGLRLGRLSELGSDQHLSP